MTNKPKHPPPSANAASLAYNKIVAEYQSESDRAAVILASSHLEVMAEWVLRAYLADSKATNELFESNGPLTTFSGRTKLAFAAGLMQNSALHDFNLIRKIRNHFAHQVEAGSFDEDPVRQWCMGFSQVEWPELRPEDSIKDKPPRSQFLSAISALSAWADWTLDRIKSGEIPRCFPPPESDRFQP